MTETVIPQMPTRPPVQRVTPPHPDNPGHDAVLAVLLSWCRANGINTDLMVKGGHLEIHEGADGPDGVYDILWREAIVRPPSGRDDQVRTWVRRTPMVVQPAGLIAGDLTCGHMSVPTETAHTWTCTQGIDPATGRHPGEHRTDDGRLAWTNAQPGQQAFVRGLPSVEGMAPHDAHALVMARLTAVLQRRPPVNWSAALVDITVHAEGLRLVADRHLPRDTRHAGIVCDHDYVSATGLTPWPCQDYRDALAGVVHFREVTP